MKVYARDMTRSEARANRFSGIRSDKHLNNFEIWIDGRLVEDVSEAAIKISPDAVALAYERAFKLRPQQIVLTK